MSYVQINEGNDKKISTLELTEGSDTVHIQRVAFDIYNTVFQKVLDTTTLSGAESFWFNCLNHPFVYIDLKFTNSNDSVNLICILEDSNGKIIVTEEYTITSTGILNTSSNVYHGELLQIDTLGFQKVKIRLTSSPSAGVIGYIGGISNGVEVNKGYVFGGTDGTNNIKNTDEYNNQTDSWTSKTDTPSPAKRSTVSSVILHKSYTTNGIESSNVKSTHEYYNNMWTSKSDSPSPARRLFAGCTILNKMYIVGGNNDDFSVFYADTDEYNPDTWTSKTDIVSPNRAQETQQMLLNKGYVVSGDDGGGGLKDNDEYNPDTWVSKTDCPSPARRLLTSFFITNKLYITYGYYFSSTIIKDTDEYNPDTWTSKTDANSPARRNLCAVSISNKGYTQYGYDGSGGIKDNDEYNPDTWTSKTDANSPGRHTLSSSIL